MNNSFPTYTKVNNVEHICNGYYRTSYICFFPFENFETFITQLQFANFFWRLHCKIFIVFLIAIVGLFSAFSGRFPSINKYGKSYSIV